MLKLEGHFRKAQPLLIRFEEDRTVAPMVSRLKGFVQGQIMFIGDYWITVAEAKALRDWISAALPDETEGDAK